MADGAGTYSAEPDVGIVRRNFVLNVLDGALFAFALSFASRSTVLPVFVDRMGGGNIAIGMIPVIWLLGFHLPQILIANRARQQERKKPLVLRTAMLQRLPWLALALITYYVVEPASPALALLLFFASFFLAAVAGSLNLPVWFDLIAKITPVKLRGRLFGWRMLLGAALGIGGGIVVERILETMSYPASFAALFGIAFGVMMVSYIFLALVREEDISEVTPKRPFHHFLGELPAILKRDRAFRNFLVADALLAMIIMAEAFYTIYAFQKFGLSEGFAGRFTIVVMIGLVVGTLFFGYLADRIGHRINLVLMSVMTIGACILALAAPSVEVYYLVFISGAFTVGLQHISRLPFIAEICGERERSTYVALSNVVTAPFVLSGLAAGWLANALGYEAVFIAAAAIALIAAVWILVMVPEPRIA